MGDIALGSECSSETTRARVVRFVEFSKLTGSAVIVGASMGLFSQGAETDTRDMQVLQVLILCRLFVYRQSRLSTRIHGHTPGGMWRLAPSNPCLYTLTLIRRKKRV